jgi:hypothetical protein
VKTNKNEESGIQTLDLACVTLWILSSLPNGLIHIFEIKCDKSQYDNKECGQNLGYGTMSEFWIPNSLGT